MPQTSGIVLSQPSPDFECPTTDKQTSAPTVSAAVPLFADTVLLRADRFT